jgi:hypothetical protein
MTNYIKDTLKRVPVQITHCKITPVNSAPVNIALTFNKDPPLQNQPIQKAYSGKEVAL